MLPTLRSRCGAAVLAASTLAGCAAADDRVAVPGAPVETSTANPSTASPSTANPTSTPTSDLSTTPSTTVVASTANPTVVASTANPTVVASTSPVVATAPILYLRAGDEGPEVTAIQERLIALEYLAAGGATGVFDRATNSAVLAFQGQYGLLVDGVVGPETRAALAAAAASVAPSE
ncbi:MAG: peptidoglycan-binding protein [Ilumatobacter sp.]|uniref:peptidoglycan-binding domain-containing protein n=1 Tax=Ilumatobacter sp. TaxID=1967498 RepID=UPI00391894CA